MPPTARRDPRGFEFSVSDFRSLRRRLLTWYRREKRVLPWRGTRDPYQIWVSEVMLQQTTVAAVRDRYAAFLRRFPDVFSLARAKEETVLAAWSGLGYYARARNLHRAARRIVREHGGRIPQEPERLASLPGFGSYMAAAVPCLAYGVRVPAAEANVTRVLSRLFLLRGRPEERRHRDAVLARAETLLPHRRPGELLAAWMDLGQILCTPRRPRCPECPLERFCLARRRGDPEGHPQKRARPRIQRLHLAAAVLTRGDRALLVRRKSSWLAGLWEFPTREGRSPGEALRRLKDALRCLGLRLEDAKPVAQTRHTIVRRQLVIEVYRVSPSPRRFSGLASQDLGLRWIRPQQFSQAAIPTLTRKVASAAGLLERSEAAYPERT
jgi:A/G-specific adenine glycosylase